MSPRSAALAPSLRNDLAACRRQFWARLRMALRDPFGLGLLAFAGVVTIPLWSYPLGIHPVWACHHPWPGGRLAYTGPAPTAVQLAFYRPDAYVASSQVLWAALVALALARQSARRRSPSTWALPALPIGARARVVADALAALSFAIVARALVLSLGGVRLGRDLIGDDPRFAFFPAVAWLFPLLQSSGSRLALVAYSSAFTVSTLLGVLLVFPLVLAWSSTSRLDGRGLLKPAVAILLVFAAVSVGAMAHLGSALLVSALVSAFLLAHLDDGERPSVTPAAHALRFRASPGPLAQLRRDSWLRFVQARWLFLALAVGLPFVPTLAYRTNFLGYTSANGPLFAKALAGTSALLQWLVLMAVPFLPCGLALIPGARPATLFSGAFLGSWSALPVPRETVVRVVYAHVLLGGALAWLVLLAQWKLLGVARYGPVQYALPASLLVATLALCEAVGDRRRGLIAVAALLGFQLGVPVTYIGLDTLGYLPAFAGHGERMTAVACAVALVGILPPLVHLRGRAGSRAALT